MRVEVWSDIVCPWCAIGRVRLRKALRTAGIDAEIVHRAFELDPGRKGTAPTLEVLAERYGSEADVEAMTRRVRDLAATEGLTLRTDKAVACNTFDAHRLLLWAQGQGRGEATMDALVAAHFGELADVSDRDVLRDVARRCGLDAEAAQSMLAGDAFRVEVRADEETAANLGVGGVPFFLFDGRYGMSGAQPPEGFARAIAMAQASHAH